MKSNIAIVSVKPAFSFDSSLISQNSSLLSAVEAIQSLKARSKQDLKRFLSDELILFLPTCRELCRLNPPSRKAGLSNIKQQIYERVTASIIDLPYDVILMIIKHINNPWQVAQLGYAGLFPIIASRHFFPAYRKEMLSYVDHTPTLLDLGLNLTASTAPTSTKILQKEWKEMTHTRHFFLVFGSHGYCEICGQSREKEIITVWEWSVRACTECLDSFTISCFDLRSLGLWKEDGIRFAHLPSVSRSFQEWGGMRYTFYWGPDVLETLLDNNSSAHRTQSELYLWYKGAHLESEKHQERQRKFERVRHALTLKEPLPVLVESHSLPLFYPMIFWLLHQIHKKDEDLVIEKICSSVILITDSANISSTKGHGSTKLIDIIHINDNPHTF